VSEGIVGIFWTQPISASNPLISWFQACLIEVGGYVYMTVALQEQDCTPLIYTVQRFGVGKIFLMLLKEVSCSPRMIKNTYCLQCATVFSVPWSFILICWFAAQ